RGAPAADDHWTVGATGDRRRVVRTTGTGDAHGRARDRAPGARPDRARDRRILLHKDVWVRGVGRVRPGGRDDHGGGRGGIHAVRVCRRDGVRPTVEVVLRVLALVSAAVWRRAHVVRGGPIRCRDADVAEGGATHVR